MAIPEDAALLPPPTQVNDTHKHYDVAIAVILMMVTATNVTVGRLVSRRSSRAFRNDDWAMISALLLYIGHGIMIVYCNLYGGSGKTLWEVIVADTYYLLQGIVAPAFTYPAMTAAVRVSILLFHHRIFGLTEMVARWSIWACFILTFVYVVIFTVIPGVICTPLSAAWHPLTRKIHCKSDQLYYDYNVALYSSSLGMDVLLLILPVAPGMRLQLPLKRLLGVLVMFVLGISSLILNSEHASYKLAIYVMQWGRTGDTDPSCRYFII
ncbi:uncharacterized protein BDR25DRAFT_321641 [Lindgomyces ingoldianus]|uniref:Uncharacterized protein n=1 Tax=Lindgomyces ingoldianus TaxID=673940 RepID=A0ACB6RFE2_9PLEO|nr:uncharacterized protein BDR25DRAFT_321641 [Lindgomyces ingoldianus]KAF2477207.1 hypothetical protein BDR25DRAFT_321641 [Lindgomyces ingoldianus]